MTDPRLILLNGLPGSGKSTLARRWAAAHPFTVALDIDVLRDAIGGWRDDPLRAGLLARRMAGAAIRAALADGRDVVVPQLLARLEAIESLASLAAEQGAGFVEILLVVPPAVASERLRARTSLGRGPELAQGTEDPDATVREYDERLARVVAARPATIRIAGGEDPWDALTSALGADRRIR